VYSFPAGEWDAKQIITRIRKILMRIRMQTPLSYQEEHKVDRAGRIQDYPDCFGMVQANHLGLC
jgi:hypothetical protein